MSGKKNKCKLCGYLSNSLLDGYIHFINKHKRLTYGKVRNEYLIVIDEKNIYSPAFGSVSDERKKELSKQLIT